MPDRQLFIAATGAEKTRPGLGKSPRPTRSISRPKPTPRRSPHKAGRGAWLVAAGGVLTVALALLGLSLMHLSAGVTILTKSSERDGFLMAVGIDLSFISLEAALLVADDATRPGVARYAVPAILGTLAVSGAMNALAFGSNADGWMIYPACALGVAIPALIFALTKVAMSLLFPENHK
jgi:hypothetical protein